MNSYVRGHPADLGARASSPAGIIENSQFRELIAGEDARAPRMIWLRPPAALCISHPFFSIFGDYSNVCFRWISQWFSPDSAKPYKALYSLYYAPGNFP
jgi:hypothetical protein